MGNQGMDLWDKNTFKGVMMTDDVCHWQGCNLWETSAPAQTHTKHPGKMKSAKKLQGLWTEMSRGVWTAVSEEQTQNSSVFHFPPCVSSAGHTVACNRIKSFSF